MNRFSQFYKTALEQSAIDLSCAPEDFLGTVNKVVLSQPDERARKYLKLPHICSIASYGSCAVASVGEEKYREGVQQYLDRYELAHLFETPNIHVLDDYFAGFGAKICFMAEYFLPDCAEESPEPPVPYRLQWLGPEDFAGLYLPEWSNALCADRKELDTLGIGAFDGERMVGFAACSADCETMWQIGVDVLPAYRGQGLATALTSRLRNGIIRRGKVPFYCAAWSNIRSVRNAISSGFRPAWAEISVKTEDFVRGMCGLKDAK